MVQKNMVIKAREVIVRLGREVINIKVVGKTSGTWAGHGMGKILKSKKEWISFSLCSLCGKGMQFHEYKRFDGLQFIWTRTYIWKLIRIIVNNDRIFSCFGFCTSQFNYRQVQVQVSTYHTGKYNLSSYKHMLLPLFLGHSPYSLCASNKFPEASLTQSA